MLLAALAVGLYKAKTEAKDDRRRAAALEAQLAEEQEAIRVMRNEIGYLESPDRLRKLAQERLGLVPIDPLRVVTLEEAPLLIERPPSKVAGKEPGSPAATVAYRYTDDHGEARP